MHPKQRLIKPALFSGSIHELLHPPANQIPFLDGLRSIAVLLVISQHLSGKFASAYGPNLYSRMPFVANGWMGVDLFFVLSGFFIGGQLWKEIQRSGSVNVGRFIVRRGFRIWPLYFFVFLCVLMVAVVSGNAAAKQYGWSDLIFLTNFHNRGLVMGSWSLCTEEQFYIIAPLLLFFCAPKLRSVRSCRPWLWGLMVGFPLLRTAVWLHLTGQFFLHSPQFFPMIYYNAATHCDGLVMGMIVSNYWVVACEKPALRLAQPGILIAVAVVLTIGLHQLQKEIFDFTILALLFGALVWFGVRRRPGIFNSRIFYWISRLSYGMYLNHEYMCPWMVRALHSRFIFSVRFPFLTNLFGVLLIAIISAAISLVTFCCVEYPFLQVRKIVLGNRNDRAASRELSAVEAQVGELV